MSILYFFVSMVYMIVATFTVKVDLRVSLVTVIVSIIFSIIACVCYAIEKKKDTKLKIAMIPYTYGVKCNDLNYQNPQKNQPL